MRAEDETMSAGDLSADHLDGGNLAPGQVFAERYEVRGPLGRGGMGAVYLVHDRQLDELVALKLLILDTERAVERFRREVRLARRVTHPNVARTHDLGEHRGLHFLTMEYVRGASLDQVLDGGPMDPARAAAVGAQIAHGLEAAHAAGVIHRDLKPANVLMAEDGRVVLTDFGIARPTKTDTRTHDTGVMIGTPHYMAPEQVLGRPVDRRTDIYAFGLILFELVTGRLPFETDSPLAAAVLRTQEPPPDPRSLAAMPDGLAELILRCLAREPDARPQTAGEIAAWLGGGEGRLDTPASRPLHTSTPSGSSLFAPISPGHRAIAVLPLAYRGAPDHEYLGDGLAEELIDVLSRTRGLRVLALGATRRFADDRDPARIGAELGADAVIDGTVHLTGDRVRVSARLLETETGVVRWSERFDSRFEDVFVLQETMARRVAEALRLELDAAAHRSVASPEAIRLYLQARRILRAETIRAPEALVMLERCLALAPDLLPAYPTHAIASIRVLWGEYSDAGADHLASATTSVARAVERAPDLAETQLVRAMLAVQNGEYASATQALARALEIAPTVAEAHYYLGELQVEAGRVTEGSQRCALALELDPTLSLAHFPLARAAGLRGDYAAAYHHLDRAEAGGASAGMATGHLRFALWRGDHETARRVGDTLRASSSNTAQGLGLIAAVAVGDAPVEQALRLLEAIERGARSPRFGSLVLQIAVEVCMAAGAPEPALEALARCAAGVLIDVEWLRRCPLLLPLVDEPVYAEALERVTQRARQLWRT